MAFTLPAGENACQKPRRRGEDIPEIRAERPRGRWSRIKGDAGYMVQLFYLAGEGGQDSPSFLYGYAVESGVDAQGRGGWELARALKGQDCSVWRVSQIIPGESLKALICHIEQGRTLGEYFQECGFSLTSRLREGRREREHARFLGAPVCQGDRDYRPEILLVPEWESAMLLPGRQPFHAFGNEPLRCEALVLRDKRSLYCREKDGGLDAGRMRLIHDVFSQEGFLANGFRDLSRIGDFEVFFPLVEGAMQEELFRVESMREEREPLKKVLTGFRITVFGGRLPQGDYVLEALAGNGGAVTGAKLWDITVRDGDVVRQMPLAESSGFLEVKLFAKREDEPMQLVGWGHTVLARDIVMNVRMSSREVTLEDEYIRKLSSQVKKEEQDRINRRVRRCGGSHESRIRDSGERDPWREEFEKVAEDFGQIYGSERAESRFFDRGMLSHEAFLSWLKNTVSRKGARVWLFDPYIDSASVPQLLRAVEDMEIQVKVVTDAKAPSRSKADRIGLLRQACQDLGEFLGDEIQFYALDGGKCRLHDRLILIFDGKFFPRVFCLSNSLDNMGMNGPSVAAKLTRREGQRAAEYYLELFEKAREAGELRVLWQGSGEGGKRQPGRAPLAGEKDERVRELTERQNRRLQARGLPALICREGYVYLPEGSGDEQEILPALCGGAEESWEDFACLWEILRGGGSRDTWELRERLEGYLARSYTPKLGEGLEKAVVRELDRAASGSPRAHSRALQVHRTPDFRQLVQGMRLMLDMPYEPGDGLSVSWPGQFAMRVLIGQDLPRFLKLLEGLDTGKGDWLTLEKETALLRALAAEMEWGEENGSRLAEACLAGGSRELTALGIAWFVRRGESQPAAELLKDTDYVHELYRLLLIDLQAKDCRRGFRGPGRQEGRNCSGEAYERDREAFLERLELVKAQWIPYFPEELTVRQLKKAFDGIAFRNRGDVCDLAVRLCDGGKLSAGRLQEYLRDCLFEKADEAYRKGSGIWQLKDFQEGEGCLEAITARGKREEREKVLERLAALERKLLRSLCDVFLEKRDYGRWKNSMDMLIWCRAMDLLCRELWEDCGELAAGGSWEQRQIEIRGLLKKYGTHLERNSEAYRILCRAADLQQTVI